MLLQPTNHIHWAPAATDSSKLRSLLLNPAQYPGVRLFEQVSTAASLLSSYAVSHEVLPHNAGVRCTTYGNLAHGQPDYTHAAQQILAIEQPEVCRFSALPEAAVLQTREVFSSSGYAETHYNPCWQYVLAGPAMARLQQYCRQKAEELLGSFYISTLQQEDAPLVDGLWTFRSPGSLAMIQQLIAQRHNVCVRTAAGQPVAWVVEVEPGCAGMLHTLEGYRRNGLGAWAMASLLCRLQQQHEQQGQDLRKAGQHVLSNTSGSNVPDSSDSGWPGGHVYCYVVQDNAASVQLLESLGLTKTGMFVWMGFEKQDSHPEQ